MTGHRAYSSRIEHLFTVTVLLIIADVTYWETRMQIHRLKHEAGIFGLDLRVKTLNLNRGGSLSPL